MGKNPAGIPLKADMLAADKSTQDSESVPLRTSDMAAEEPASLQSQTSILIKSFSL